MKRKNIRQGGLKLRTQRRERRAWMGVYIAFRDMYRSLAERESNNHDQ